MTLNSFQGACHFGLGIAGGLRGRARAPAGAAVGVGPVKGTMAPSEPSAADSAISVSVESIWMSLNCYLEFSTYLECSTYEGLVT